VNEAPDEILSPIVENCFNDSETNEGVNALGTYYKKMKLCKELPKVLPMCGKTVKIYYKRISTLLQLFWQSPTKAMRG
jgi:hypothetical protein